MFPDCRLLVFRALGSQMQAIYHGGDRQGVWFGALFSHWKIIETKPELNVVNGMSQQRRSTDMSVESYV